MPYTLSIDQNVIKSTNTVKLLGLNIGHKLIFNFHKSKWCSKVAMQLVEAIINSFIFANFCPVARKTEQTNKHCFRIVLNGTKYSRMDVSRIKFAEDSL